jgi:hypothetical protein
VVDRRRCLDGVTSIEGPKASGDAHGYREEKSKGCLRIALAEVDRKHGCDRDGASSKIEDRLTALPDSPPYSWGERA